MIYHITTRAEWESARRSGEYRASSLESEGFIHFSRRDQVMRVAERFYRGQSGLVLLVVDPDRLTARLVFEPPINPQTGQTEPGATEDFPHLYGPLNADAVVRAVTFEPDADKSFRFPEEG